MPHYSQLNPLTNRQQDLCSYTGVFGALLALTCLVQHIMITKAHWITYTLTFFYILIIVAFILLAFQHSFSPIALIIAAVLSLIAEYILIKNGVFSLVVLLLFIFTVVIVVVLYTDSVPALLRQKALAKRAEEDEWRGKI